jgi:ubiquinone/menaquinone biosynthesis C-methylase UbiE
MTEVIDGYFARKYDEEARRNMLPFYREFAEKVVSEIKEGKVLEIGPGPGYIAIFIAQLSRDIEIIGLDASRTMVEIAGKNAEICGLSERVKFTEGNAEQIPYEDSHFDMIVSSGSLHHWRNPRRVFREIHRVLKPGGRAFIRDLRRDTSREEVDKIAREIKSWVMRWGFRRSVREAYTKEEVPGLLKDLNFSSVNVEVEGPNMEIFLVK